MPQKISEQQKNILEVIAEEVQKMETQNDVQYALKGLLAELSHLSEDPKSSYFDPAYIAEKASIIHQGIY